MRIASFGQWGAYFAFAASLAFGQGGDGTITGTVTDPAGAVVAGANLEAKSTETGGVYTAASTSAGVYSISNLPVGTYTLSATAPGFKTYTHPNLAIAATAVVREDIGLQVGSASESVTVQAESSLLKTETAELSHNLTVGQLDDLPLLGIGTSNAGPTAIRNPFNSLEALPGFGSFVGLGPGYGGVNFNGQPSGSGFSGANPSIRIEGQDATPRALGYQATAQPGVDAIQEVAFQTSNYAPEFGTTSSVLFNFIMKSGTNQFHGSAYDYFVNEDLNAGNPYSVNTSGIGKVRPRNRRNDFGGTLGGPVHPQNL